MTGMTKRMNCLGVCWIRTERIIYYRSLYIVRESRWHWLLSSHEKHEEQDMYTSMCTPYAPYKLAINAQARFTDMQDVGDDDVHIGLKGFTSMQTSILVFFGC